MAKTKGFELGKYDPRGSKLGKDFMTEFKSFPYIMDYACNRNNGLDVQLRGQYINIYYAGGNLIKLSKKSTCEFDENYFYLPSRDDLCMTDIERLCHKDYQIKSKSSKALKCLSEYELVQKRALAINIKKTLEEKRDKLVKRLSTCTNLQETSIVLDEMKDIMDNWKNNLVKNGKRKHIVGERIVQHYLSLYNKLFDEDTDFMVLDIEYAISSNAYYAKEYEREKQPRIDIIAIERNTWQLYVMELKYGLDATDGDASIEKHYNDYLATVGDDFKWKAFINDINTLLEKKEKWLFNKEESDYIKLLENKPIFAYILKEKEKGDEELFIKQLKAKNLQHIPTLYLPKEDNYEKPSESGHKLLKKRIK